MDKDKQPGINFKSITLVKEEFWRDYNVPEETTPDINIGFGWSVQENDYVVELSTTLRLLHQEQEKLKLDTTFIGVFSVIENNENMNIEEYIKSNSVALMFPYIREHISTITQKSGIRPVLLPPINVVALIKRSELLKK